MTWRPRTRHGWIGAVAALATMGAPLVARSDGVGLGLGIDPSQFGSGAADLLIAGRNSAPISLYLPIQVSPNVRLEPSASYFEVHRDMGNTPAGGSPYSFSATAAGFGALYYVRPPAPLGLYLGGRLTLALYSGTFMDQPLPIQARQKVTELDLFLAPVVGGEYAFSRRFAVGAEIQLPVALLGDQSARTMDGEGTPNMGNRVATNTVLFLRYFFR